MLELAMSYDSITACARCLLEAYPEQRVWAFYAPMGAGKTTLIKALCAELGVTDPVSSPTFAIVNEYHRTTKDPIYHFDFYRIQSIREAYDIGYEEYFFSGHYCFIEWSEHIESLLDLDHLRVTLSMVDPSNRLIHVQESYESV